MKVKSSFPVQIQAWFEREREKWPSALELLPVENVKLLQPELRAGHPRPTVGAAQPSLRDPRVSAQLVLMVDSLGSSSAVRKDNS